MSAASASRWHGQFVRAGDVAAKPQGGDRRSRETEVHAALILNVYEADSGIFLSEL